MSVDFGKFDKLVNQEEVKKAIAEAPQTDDVPAGTYRVSIDKMEVEPTKAGDKLMFSIGLRIRQTIEAPRKQDNRLIFFHRVICGNKTTEKWSDSKAIAGVVTWVNEFLHEDEAIEFQSYSQFADEILDVFQNVAGDIELEIKYDPEKFNPISIVDVFDL